LGGVAAAFWTFKGGGGSLSFLAACGCFGIYGGGSEAFIRLFFMLYIIILGWV
jgi:hypothetical protein